MKDRIGISFPVQTDEICIVLRNPPTDVVSIIDRITTQFPNRNEKSLIEMRISSEVKLGTEIVTRRLRSPLTQERWEWLDQDLSEDTERVCWHTGRYGDQ